MPECLLTGNRPLLISRGSDALCEPDIGGRARVQLTEYSTSLRSSRVRAYVFNAVQQLAIHSTLDLLCHALLTSFEFN